MTDRQLRGWKEIAVYFDTSPRTVQRWERRHGLPVRRVGAVVYARRDELEAWSNTVAGRAGLAARQDEPDDEAEVPEADGAGPAAIEALQAALAAATTSGALVAAEGTGSDSPASVAPPPAEVRRGRAVLVLGLAVAVLALALVWLARAWPPSVSYEAVTPATAHEAAAPVSATEPPDPLAPFGGVDVGPWPMIHHDPQRANRSHLRGPAPGVDVRRLFTLPGIPPLGSPLPLAITPDGTIVVGACGFVGGLAPDGRQRWRVPLGTPGRLEEPGGITLRPGLVSLTTRDCPDSPDTSPRVGLYLIAGTTVVRDPHPGAPWGPTIAPGMPTITIDEFTMVRAYDHVPRFLWANDLPGYSSVPPAVGFDGAFFVLTDGGAFNQPSLWAIERDGRVRWSATDLLIPSQIAVTPAGVVLLPDREQRRLHAVSPRDGSVLWTREIEGQMAIAALAVAATGDAYVKSTTALTALAPDGSVRWRFALGGDGGLGLAPVVDVEGHVYVAFGDRVYSLTSAGERRWEAEVPKARDLFLAADGVLYAVSGERALVAIEAEKSK